MKIAMRFYMAALLAIAVTSAFAQGTDDNAFKQRVFDAAGKYKAGNSSGALADFLALNSENSKNSEVNSWIGFLYLRNKDAKQAIPFLESARALSPKDLEVLNNLGNAYLMAGQSTRALNAYQDLIGLDSGRYQAYYNMGNIQLGEKKYAAAEQNFMKALALQKDMPQINNNLGVAQQAQDKLGDAFASFSKASNSKMKEATYARNAGACAYRLKDYPNTIKFLKRAMSIEKQDSKIILALADAYGKTGDSQSMMDLYEKYKDTFDGDFNYYFNYGVLKQNVGDMAGAEMGFTKANRLKPTDGETRQNLGVIKFKQRKFAEAKSLFAPIDGDGGVAMTITGKKNLAAAASRTGDFHTAVPLWSEVLKMDKNDQEVRLLLADAVFDSGDSKNALTMYKEILAARSNSAAALDGIGRCSLRDDKYVSAEASFRSAINADKMFVPAYNNLAVVLEKMNRRPEAIVLLEKAASMDGNNADVMKNLKRMRSVG